MTPFLPYLCVIAPPPLAGLPPEDSSAVDPDEAVALGAAVQVRVHVRQGLLFLGTSGLSHCTPEVETQFRSYRC